MTDWRGSKLWTSLTPAQRLALMGAMEADKGERWFDSATNTISANANRAGQLGWDTDRVLNHKGKGRRYGWFQPLDEPSQYARAQALMQRPEFAGLVREAEGQIARLQGAAGALPDRVNGATHYLSHARVMRDLEAKEPSKYRDWGPRGSNWSGYDPKTGDYRSKTYEDASHSFIAPQGAYRSQPSDYVVTDRRPQAEPSTDAPAALTPMSSPAPMPSHVLTEMGTPAPMPQHVLTEMPSEPPPEVLARAIDVPKAAPAPPPVTPAPPPTPESNGFDWNGAGKVALVTAPFALAAALGKMPGGTNFKFKPLPTSFNTGGTRVSSGGMRNIVEFKKK